MNTLRIAIRAEGPSINAYFAMTGSMDEAVLIGSINRALCNQDRKLFEQFKALMTNCCQVLIEQIGGKKVLTVFEQDAPEHEKAGHA